MRRGLRARRDRSTSADVDIPLPNQFLLMTSSAHRHLARMRRARGDLELHIGVDPLTGEHADAMYIDDPNE